METAANRLALPKGFMLAEYRIEEILGSGGFGITYKAVDTKLDAKVAIKEYIPNTLAVREDDFNVLPKGVEYEEDFDKWLQRFQEEARILARFDHPNIVRVLRIMQANSTAYTVMAFEDGESLESYLRRKGKDIAQPELLTMMENLFEAVDVLHRQGITHRDIKPGNIIIRKTGQAVLIDFGAARPFGSVERGGSSHSTYTDGYSPYEQYTESGDKGPWTDIYSLGAVLYRAVTGQIPTPATERFLRISDGKEDPQRPATSYKDRGYSVNFLNAIDWALAVRPQNRPQSMAEWRPYLVQAQDTVPRHDPDPTTAPPPAARRREAPAPAKEKRRDNQPRPKPQPVTAKAPMNPASMVIYSIISLLMLASLGYAYHLWEEWEEEGRVESQIAADIQRCRQFVEVNGLAEARAICGPYADQGNPEAKLLMEAVAQKEEEARRFQAERVKAQREQWLQRCRQLSAANQYREVLNVCQPLAEAGDAEAGELVKAATIMGDILRPLRAFRDCEECPEMVVLPAGGFLMGSGPRDEGASGTEMPQHQVTIREPIAMGRHEVTFDQWGACVADGGCQHRPDDENWGRGTKPVINVSWIDAQEYVAWLSRKTGATYRLPSEAEWEYAARAGSTTAYFWGTLSQRDAACQFANSADLKLLATVKRLRTGYVNCDDGHAYTSPVGSFRPNAFALHDMVGNVFEWTQDCFFRDYRGVSSDGRPRVEGGDCRNRTVRGSAALSDPLALRTAARLAIPANRRLNTLGIRVVRELP